MNYSEQPQDSNEHKEKFDPLDSWDVHIASLGKSLKGVDKKATPEECFEEGVGFVSGRRYEDGFGSWNPGSGDWITEAPEKVVQFDENLINGVCRAQVDFSVVGQPDGPGTSGHVWAVRLWDQEENKAVENSNVFSNKLSHGVTAALAKAPEWATSIWKTKKELIKHGLFVESKRAVYYLKFYLNREDKVLEEIIKNKFSESSSTYKDILLAGGIDEWIEKKEKEGEEIESLTKKLFNLGKELFAFIEVGSKQHNENLAKDFIDDEDDASDGDGWLPPPQWKK
jgi:phosphoribosyl-ATP pyrophosphohydrolase